MAVDPALLAQADREKAAFDNLLTRLVEEYRSELANTSDSTVAFFLLMEELEPIEKWKLAGALSAAVHRLAS